MLWRKQRYCYLAIALLERVWLWARALVAGLKQSHASQHYGTLKFAKINEPANQKVVIVFQSALCG